MGARDWLTVGIVAAVGYAAYKATTAVGKATGAAYTGAVNWTSDLFTSWFGPDQTGTDLYHLVNFPDGTRHAVGANIVDSNGQFTWTGYPPGSQSEVNYQLGRDSAGNWVAVSR